MELIPFTWKKSLLFIYINGQPNFKVSFITVINEPEKNNKGRNINIHITIN